MSTSSHKELSIAGVSLTTAAPGIALSASSVKAASAVGATVVNRAFARATVLIAVCSLTASNTPTTLDVDLEASLDGGTNWYQLGKFSQFGAVATGIKLLKFSSTGAAVFTTEIAASTTPAVGTGAAVVNNFMWDSWLRTAYTVVGTSYTFSVYVIPYLSP